MDTLRLPASLAALVTTNVAPVIGILILGWSPIAILVLYFVDTLLGLGVVMAMVMVHVTGNGSGRRFSGMKDWAEGAWALVVLGAIFGLPLSFPLWIVGGDAIVEEFRRPGHAFLYGILLQLAMSALGAVRMHRDLNARADDERILVRRALLLLARWITLFIAAGLGLVNLLGPTWGAFVLVTIYGGASIWFELHPARAERFVRGAGAKPIRYQADLDQATGVVATTPHAEVAAAVPHAKRTRRRRR